MKIKKRIFIGAVIVLLITPASIYAAPKVNNFYQGYKLEKEGDKLLAKNEYQVALGTYKKSQEKWNDGVISEKIQETEDIVESDESYQEGLEAISDDDWDEAIVSLSKVKPAHKDYESAEKMLDYAKEKKDEAEEEKVKGATTEIKKTPVYVEKPVYIQESSSPSPTPTPSPTIEPLPTPEVLSPSPYVPNLDGVCNNKAQIYVNFNKPGAQSVIMAIPSQHYGTDCFQQAYAYEQYLLSQVDVIMDTLKSNFYLRCIQNNGNINEMERVNWGEAIDTSNIPGCN